MDSSDSEFDKITHKLERSLSDDITGETTENKGKLSYRTSFKNIKGQIPKKQIVFDSVHNNSVVLDKIFPNLQQQLLDILSNHELCLIFREFLVSQQCAENFDFFVEVELLRREKNHEAFIEDAESIYKKYFGGKVDLNVDSDLREDIDNKIRNREFEKTMFDNVQQTILRLLETSCISRFVSSDMYKQWSEPTPSSPVVEEKKPRKAKSFNGRSTSRVYAKSWSEESRNVEKFFELVREEERARALTDPVPTRKIESGE